MERAKKKIEELENQVHRFENDEDYYARTISELEDRLAKKEDCFVINDFEDFKIRMKADGIWTPELEEFIDSYMKFNN